MSQEYNLTEAGQQSHKREERMRAAVAEAGRYKGQAAHHLAQKESGMGLAYAVLALATLALAHEKDG